MEFCRIASSFLSSEDVIRRRNRWEQEKKATNHAFIFISDIIYSCRVLLWFISPLSFALSLPSAHTQFSTDANRHIVFFGCFFFIVQVMCTQIQTLFWTIRNTYSFMLNIKWIRICQTSTRCSHDHFIFKLCVWVSECNSIKNVCIPRQISCDAIHYIIYVLFLMGNNQCAFNSRINLLGSLHQRIVSRYSV